MTSHKWNMAFRVPCACRGWFDTYFIRRGSRYVGSNGGRVENAVHKVFFSVILAVLPPGRSVAEVTEYDLTIRHEQVNITGKPASGMTINGIIPGPVLRFTEGDTARIHVRNTMDVPTSIHWHGLLVPPGMDGVPYVSFPGIAPGEIFTYEFVVRQSGTYWYHSHTELQEQRGVYGGIAITPREGPVYAADRDCLVVLSDWTNEDPHTVLRTLKRGSHWYALAKGGSQSIVGATRARRFGDFFKREILRMPPMDISDIAYDRFLANGRESTHLEAKSGETVRLRIVDGSATTFFHLSWAGGPLRVVAADGQNIEPFEVDRLLIGVAETYDILVRVPQTGSHELRATAHDGSAAASVWLGKGEPVHAPVVPRPDVYQGMGSLSFSRVFALTPAASMGMGRRKVLLGAFDSPGMMGNMDMDMEEMSMDEHSMEESHTAMDTDKSSEEVGGTSDEKDHIMSSRNRGPMKTEMPMNSPENSTEIHAERDGKSEKWNFRPMGPDISSSDLAPDGRGPPRPWPPYDKLRATASTAPDDDMPVRTIRLTLDGDMERYVWFINNRPISSGDVIHIREGEVVRFIMINRTMMHHPMHLHGHFFRVVNTHGDYSPLKHTVDVAPMSTTVIEFVADEFGDWFFHCHLLYHMKSGMARVVEYDQFTPTDDVVESRRKLYRDPWYALVDAEMLSAMSEGAFSVSNSLNIFELQWEAGWPGLDEIGWQGLLVYKRYFSGRLAAPFSLVMV